MGSCMESHTVSKAYIPLHQSRRHAMRNCIECSVRERYRISHGPLFTFLSTELIPDNNLFTKKEIYKERKRHSFLLVCGGGGQ